MKIFGWFVLVFFILTVTITTCNFMSDGAKTINKEFNPSALLAKYEYFKDLSSAIDKKRADIEMYRDEIQSLDDKDKDDKFYKQQRKSELIGIITMHNELCAKYNADMSKFNYRFTNVGDLPASNLEPLPREIKPYILKLNK